MGWVWEQLLRRSKNASGPVQANAGRGVNFNGEDISD
jgi:hypothetical protein